MAFLPQAASRFKTK